MQRLVSIAFIALCTAAALAGPAKTALVEQGDLEVATDVKGLIGPGRSAAVRLAPLAYRGRFEVTMAAEPGSRVSEGEVVVRFDDKDLREALENARYELEVARRGMDALRDRQALAVRDSELGLEAKERELELAEAAMERYFDHDRPQADRRAEHDEEGYKVNVANAKEELAQLLKMYEEDELVDDTEDIVLERARWDLLNRERRFDYWRLGRALQIRYEIPAHEYGVRRNVMLRRIALEKARREEKHAEIARRTEMERAERAMKERLEGIEDLEADLAALVVRAPRAGILLHGEAGTGVGRLISPGDTVNAQTVLITIADPDDLRIHMKLPAKETLRLRVGQAVHMKADAVGAPGIAGTVEHREILPREGVIVSRAAAEGGLSPDLLGIPVSGRLVFEVVRNALLVPVAAVQREGDAAFVHVAGEGGERVRIDVTVGPDDGKRICIVSGLAAGDVVLLPEAAE